MGLFLPLLVEVVEQRDAEGAALFADVVANVVAELVEGVVFGGDAFLLVDEAPRLVVEAAAPHAGFDVAAMFGGGEIGEVQQVVEVSGA